MLSGREGLQMSTEEPLSTPEALQEWREAERTAAVARRGKEAAQVAVKAAEEAAEAAIATATAAKQALDAATLAEASAAKTAASARVMVESARSDLVDAISESDIAEVGENAARDIYQRAADEAGAR